MKRGASASMRNSTRLKARASPYHTSVTLYEDQGSYSAGPSESPRRSKRIKFEVKTETLVDLEDAVPATPNLEVRKLTTTTIVSEGLPSPTKAIRYPRKVKPIQQSLAVPHPAPLNWRQTYDTIQEMRSRIVAPVDTMGCDQAQFKETDPKVSKLVACNIMLSHYSLRRTAASPHSSP